tara:strand:- start:84 stop:410 length:327 start_codon:yes stop_codon:yes gene_type:complete
MAKSLLYSTVTDYVLTVMLLKGMKGMVMLRLNISMYVVVVNLFLLMRICVGIVIMIMNVIIVIHTKYKGYIMKEDKVLTMQELHAKLKQYSNKGIKIKLSKLKKEGIK